MPARQVYGKRTAGKPTTSYAKFISPSKDTSATKEGGIPEGRAKKGTKKAPVDQTANNEAELGDLIGELGGLRIGSTDGGALAEMNPEQPISKRRGNTRKPSRTAESSPKRKSSTEDGPEFESKGEPIRCKEEADPIILSEQLHALDISKNDDQPSKISRQRKSKSRRPRTSPEEPSSSEDVKDPANHEQAAQSKHQAIQQTIPETPTRPRKLKAVVIPKSKAMSQLATSSPTTNPQDPVAAYVSPLLALQSYGESILSFKEWSSSLQPYFCVSKIAEASFSEVYRLSALDNTCKSMRESVLKLVPLKSAPHVPLKKQPRSARNPGAQQQVDQAAREEEDSWKSSVDDVYSEVKLLQNLNYIPGFTNFRELTVLQGRPSKAFNDAWRSWNKARPRGKKSQFPDPSKKASYEDSQLWAVIEMQDAGTDVEKVMDKGGLSTVWEIWDVFWGVCLSVAKAEEACRFEHRDLHLENICIRSSRTESEEDLLNPIIKDPLGRKFGFTGLETTVIDYTLSRADVTSGSRCSPSAGDASSPSQASPSTPSTTSEVAFLDLDKDMGLFAGDASEEYQYEIYRYMRGAVLHNDPLQFGEAQESETDQLRRSPRKTAQHIRFDDPQIPTPNLSPRRGSAKDCHDIWRGFHPKTNLVWAHFILHQLLAHLSGYEPANLSSAQVMRNVEVSGEEKSKVVRKAMKLYKVLERVAQLLEPSALAGNGALGSMKELAVLAMEERWLRVGDVAGA